MLPTFVITDIRSSPNKSGVLKMEPGVVDSKIPLPDTPSLEVLLQMVVEVVETTGYLSLQGLP